MEIRTENTEDITKFFLFFNEIMEKHTGKIGIKFNTRYFVCDEMQHLLQCMEKLSATTALRDANGILK